MNKNIKHEDRSKYFTRLHDNEAVMRYYEKWQDDAFENGKQWMMNFSKDCKNLTELKEKFFSDEKMLTRFYEDQKKEIECKKQHLIKIYIDTNKAYDEAAEGLEVAKNEYEKLLKNLREDYDHHRNYTKKVQAFNKGNITKETTEPDDDWNASATITKQGGGLFDKMSVEVSTSFCEYSVMSNDLTNEITEQNEINKILLTDEMMFFVEQSTKNKKKTMISSTEKGLDYDIYYFNNDSGVSSTEEEYLCRLDALQALAHQTIDKTSIVLNDAKQSIEYLGSRLHKKVINSLTER